MREPVGSFMVALEQDPSPGARTSRWHIDTTDAPLARAHLGIVKWYAPWRRYVLVAHFGCLFDAQCLDDLADFCRRKTDAQKATWKRAKPVPCPIPTAESVAA